MVCFCLVCVSPIISVHGFHAPRLSSNGLSPSRQNAPRMWKWESRLPIYYPQALIMDCWNEQFGRQCPISPSMISPPSLMRLTCDSTHMSETNYILRAGDWNRGRKETSRLGRAANRR